MTLPILRDLSVLQSHPFESLDGAVLALFAQAKERLPTQEEQEDCVQLLQILECFLQITGRQLREINLSRPDFEITCRAFLGALHSKSFINGSDKFIYAKSRLWLALLAATAETTASMVCPQPMLSPGGVTRDVLSCVALFNRQRLVEEKVWLWRGWPSTHRHGPVRHFPLLPVYKRMGGPFTLLFYQACDQYFVARKAPAAVVLNSLTGYIGGYPSDLAATDFQDPEFVSQFSHEFFAYFITAGFANGNGVCISTLVAVWRSGFNDFVTDALVPSGLFAAPQQELPSPEPRSVCSPFKDRCRREKCSLDLAAKR